MNPIIYISLTCLILTSCQSKGLDTTKEGRGTQRAVNSLKADSPEQVIELTEPEPEQDNGSIFIADSSKYSTRFLKEIEEAGMEYVTLVDSFLILGQNDTVTFPQTPKIGKRVFLTARNDELTISLTLERINQTTLEYAIEMVDQGSASYNFKGQADLSPNFYMGAETDESSVSGISYLATEFSDTRDSCYTYIRLGKEEDSGSLLLGKLIKNCNGDLGDIGLDDFPTLVER